jgi:hypothetical protein
MASGQELTDNQMLLLYWADRYKQVFELPFSHKPSDDVVGDDDAFDTWALNFEREMVRLARQQARGNKGPAGSMMMDAADFAFGKRAK